MGQDTVADNVCILDLMCKDKYSDANNHKHARDDFSDQSKMWILRRNNYGEMARDNVAKAAEARKERDEINEKVKLAKARRDELHLKAADLRESGTDNSEVREEGNKCHEEVTELSAKGQDAHQRMLTFYEEADVARKLSDAAQKKSIECRKAADAEHAAYIRIMKSIDDLKNNLPDDL